MAARPLLFLAALLALSIAPAVQAHTPVVNKASFKGKTVFTIVQPEVAPPSVNWAGAAFGDRLVSVTDVKADGHGHFPRYQTCTAVCVVPDCPLGGKTFQCTTESIFPLGSVVSQGTLVLSATGVLSGSSALTGGTGSFKGFRGTEASSYDTVAKTGATKWWVM